ncbi:MAG: futalosine hydrolase [Planctomycetota bacterium]|nr:futalosine hydrolase [Planctomycetota bacterium]MDP6518713.1 futalosine hydrolase [Planctomycetota bacterium]MDP6838402.1 futalosine hydrolase [Planctomycetota bacterium]
MANTSDDLLVLVPTGLEMRRLLDGGGLGAELELCGFGPVAAAARTAQLLATRPIRRVLLLGIAGSFAPQEGGPAVGTALEFSAVALSGVGAGEGEAFRGPPALGFPQWPGTEWPGSQESSAEGASAPIEDRLALARPAGNDIDALLLTTCAASDTPAQAATRLDQFPDARAEDMEAFAVALACALAGVPLRVVRGISNAVGDRDPVNWCIPAALEAARRLAAEIVADCTPWTQAPLHAELPSPLPEVSGP